MCLICLCRENEVLKVQLKKYVGAVQMLKREGCQGNDGKTHMHAHTRTHLLYDLGPDFYTLVPDWLKHTEEEGHQFP